MKKILLLLIIMQYQSCMIASSALESKEDSDYQSDGSAHDDDYQYYSAEEGEYNDDELILINQYDNNNDHEFNIDDQITFTYIIENYPHLKHGFNLIRKHELGADLFFGNFLKKAMAEDDYDLGEVISNLQKDIADSTKDHFLSVLHDAIINNIKLKNIQDPIFLYCMSLINNFMSAYMNDWVHDQKDLIVSSVNNNNIEALHLLLNLGCDPNFTDDKGQSLLMIALKKDYREIAMLLLAQPSINFNNVNYTIAAIDNNNTQALQGMITLGLDPNSTNDKGESLLIRAVLAGAQDVFQLLLAQPNIQVNYQDESSNTALIKAAGKNQIKMVGMLLDNPGININLYNELKRTALYAAVYHGNTAIVEMLLARPDIDLQLTYSFLSTALMIASLQNHAEIVKALLAHRSTDVNARDDSGSSALMIAAQKGYLEIVQLLINASANPDITNNNGFNALIEAARAGKTDTVRFLLHHITDINVKDKNQHTALFYAAQKGHLEIVQLLINAGADKEIVQIKGNRPYDFITNPLIKEIFNKKS